MRMTITYELDTGPVQTVHAGAGDMMRYELTARKQHWGTMADMPLLSSAFLAWSAAKRSGLYTDTWESFRDALVDLDTSAGDDSETDVDPTRPAPPPGELSS